MLMSSPSAHACATYRMRRCGDGPPFNQIEPSRSMHHRSGNPVRIPKLKTSEWSFTRGFMIELMTD